MHCVLVQFEFNVLIQVFMIKKSPWWRRVAQRPLQNVVDTQVLKTCTGVLLEHGIGTVTRLFVHLHINAVKRYY